MPDASQIARRIPVSQFVAGVTMLDADHGRQARILKAEQVATWLWRAAVLPGDGGPVLEIAGQASSAAGAADLLRPLSAALLSDGYVIR